jgi:hypothetical protein
MANNNTLPERIPNMQICYVASYLRDWHYSVNKSQAADQADGFVVMADLVRLKDRVADALIQWAFLHEMPLLDCPESHGVLDYEVPVLEDLPEPENKDVKLISNMLVMVHREFVTCQSARLITGIQEWDYGRGVTYFNNITTLIDSYIEPRTPNDWPKAAPEEDQVGAGRGGV